MEEDTIPIREIEVSFIEFIKSDFKNTIHDYLDSKSIINLMLTCKDLYDFSINRMIPKKFISSSSRNIFMNKICNNKNNDEYDSSKNEKVFRNLSDLWLLHLSNKYDINNSVDKCNESNLNIDTSFNQDFKTLDNGLASSMVSTTTYREFVNKDNDKYTTGVNINLESHSYSDLDLNKNKTNSKILETYDAIDRDINRTFHFGRFKSENGRINLRDILRYISQANPNIGYCQGMNFVAGTFLEITNSVEKSIFIFQKLITHYELYYIYIEVRLILFYLSKCLTIA